MSMPWSSMTAHFFHAAWSGDYQATSHIDCPHHSCPGSSSSAHTLDTLSPDQHVVQPCARRKRRRSSAPSSRWALRTPRCATAALMMTLSIVSALRGGAASSSDDWNVPRPRFIQGAGELPVGVDPLRPNALSQLNPYRTPPNLRSRYEHQPALRSNDERDWVYAWNRADEAEARALAERDDSSVTPSGSPDNLVDISITQPQSCAPMNITFDPSKGTPPYTVHIGFSEWYPYIFSVPASYSDPKLALWLVQFMVPIFKKPGVSSPPNPQVIVSITDSTGAMTNSSAIAQVNSPDPGVSCAGVSGSLDFVFWSDPTQTQCLPFSVTWAREGTQKGWTPPLGLYFLPEQSPPLYLPIANASAGGLNWTMIIPAAKRFLMTMADAGPLGGGVSGLNTVGGSEYANKNCVDNVTAEAHSLPRPTTTLTDRMPDFTASVASLTTDNGIVATQTVVQTVRNGKALRPADPTSAVIGASVGAGLAVGIAAAFIAWFCWRRRQKKRTNLSWDLPDNVAGQLNGSNAPMDKKLLQRAGGGATIFAVAGRNLYPRGTAPNRTAHANSVHGSFRSLGSSAYDARYDSGDVGSPQSSDAPGYHQSIYATSPPSGPQRPYSDFSPTNSDGNWPLSRPAVAARAGDGQEVLISDSPPSATPSSRGFQGSTRESVSSGSVRQSGNAYRSPFSATATYPYDGTMRGNGYEEVPMSEPMYHSSSMSYHGHNGASSHAMTRQTSAGSSGDSPITSMAPSNNARPAAAAASSTLPPVRQGFVQHSDAGLLLDDTMDEEEGSGPRRGDGLVELPPQYDAVPPRTPHHARSSTSGSNTPSGPSSGSGTYQSTSSSRGGRRGSGSGTNGSQQHLMARSPLSRRLPEGDISNANQPFAADLLDEGADEDEFWRAS